MYIRVTKALTSLSARHPTLLVDRGEDDGVGDDNDKERNEVHHDHAENGVSSLVALRGERMKRHALSVPRKIRVGLHMENVHLN